MEVLAPPPKSNSQRGINTFPTHPNNNRPSTLKFTDDVDGIVRCQNYFMETKQVNKQTPLNDIYLKSLAQETIPPVFQIPDLDKPQFASLKSAIKYKILLDAIQESTNLK